MRPGGWRHPHSTSPSRRAAPEEVWAGAARGGEGPVADRLPPSRPGLLGSVLLPGPVVCRSGSPWPPDAGNQVAHWCDSGGASPPRSGPGSHACSAALFTVGSSPHCICADTTDRLTQAVWNLVRNAIQAGAGNITLRTRVEHGVRIAEQLHTLALRLEIADDGRGVPEELAEHLFLPLVSGRAEGTGLGLALAQQVAREHRGTLTYRSRPGHTVFTLLLSSWA